MFILSKASSVEWLDGSKVGRLWFDRRLNFPLKFIPKDTDETLFMKEIYLAEEGLPTNNKNQVTIAQNI